MATTIKTSIEGMTCAHCVKTVEEEVKKVKGVESVKASVGSAEIRVGEETEAVKKDIEKAIETAGYKVSALGASKKKAGSCCC